MVKFNAFWQRATRFTLRSLLLVTVFACFAFAWFAHHYRNYQTELRFLADLTKIQNDKTVDLDQPNDLGAFTLAAFNNATDGWLMIPAKSARVSVRWNGPDFLRYFFDRGEHAIFQGIDELIISDYKIPRSAECLPSLRKLEFSTSLRKQDEQDLETLANLHQVEELVLSLARSGPTPYQHLPPNLQTLVLPRYNPAIDNQELAKLQRQRPELEIHRLSEGKRHPIGPLK